MRISARVQNAGGKHQVVLKTNGLVHGIDIPPKSSGSGSSVNGGELLFLALATCYCNDVYREAAKRGMAVGSVEVEVEGEFGAEGDPATGITYKAKVAAHGTEQNIKDLLRHTDTVAEIQNTLRRSTPVLLSHIEVYVV